MNSDSTNQHRKLSSIDYLSRLPIEIWREIFRSTYPLLSIHKPRPIKDPYVFFEENHNVGCVYSTDTQKERAALRRVCKALEPLALELLFVSVTGIMIHDLFISLLSSATSKTSTISCPGRLTRCITLSFQEKCTPAELWTPLLSRLRVAFPNAHTLNIGRPGGYLEYRHHPVGISALRGFKHVRWFQRVRNTRDDILFSLTQNNDLESLYFDSESEVRSRSKVASLPNLKMVALEFLHHASYILTPSNHIETLCLKFTFERAVPELGLCVDRLTFLGLSWEDSAGPIFDIDLALQILYMAVNVHTLSTGSSRACTVPKNKYGQHPSLHTMIITVSTLFLFPEANHPVKQLERWGFTGLRWQEHQFERVCVRWDRYDNSNSLETLREEVLEKVDLSHWPNTQFIFEWSE